MLKKFWDALFGPLVSSESTYFVAKLERGDFLNNIRLEPNIEGETTHLIVMEFSEPVREGNDVSHLNFREEDGSIFDSRELPTGSTSLRLPINPEHWKFDVIAVDTDKSVVGTDTVIITEEVLEES